MLAVLSNKFLKSSIILITGTVRFQKSSLHTGSLVMMLCLVIGSPAQLHPETL